MFQKPLSSGFKKVEKIPEKGRFWMRKIGDLHKTLLGEILPLAENSMGQGVLNIFHRLFHRLGCKRTRCYVNAGTTEKNLAKKEIFCKK